MRHFLVRNVLHFYGLPLWVCAGVYRSAFAKHATIFANTPQSGEMRHVFTGKAPQSLEKHPNPWKSTTILGKAPQSLEKCHNPWKSTVILGKVPQSLVLYKMAHFEELRRTQRDKRGARYTVLISAAAAHGTPC